MNLLTFGVPTGKKFRIGFDYYAHGRRYSDEFQSAVAIPQNERIRIAYNPLRPQENNRSSSGPGSLGTGREALIGVGIGGSIVLSLAWLALLRGCR